MIIINPLYYVFYVFTEELKSLPKQQKCAILYHESQVRIGEHLYTNINFGGFNYGVPVNNTTVDILWQRWRKKAIEKKQFAISYNNITARVQMLAARKFSNIVALVTSYLRAVLVVEMKLTSGRSEYYLCDETRTKRAFTSLECGESVRLLTLNNPRQPTTPQIKLIQNLLK